MADWHRLAREVVDYSSGDKFFAIEEKDPRVSFDRLVVSGGVSDGRPEKPGVVLVVLTSDGTYQELGVSSREQASMILTALRDAWPDLGVA